MEEKSESYQFQWIINEGLLRDEGVLFGIAGATIGEKVEAIRDYYRIKKAPGQTKREQLEKDLVAIAGDFPERTAEKRHSVRVVNLVPVALQTALYGGICYFNFYLEEFWLSPILHSTLICMGLYTFGLFSVFIGRSIMYNNSGSLGDGQASSVEREKWKIYLEEFGVPLVVSIFIVVLAREAYPILNSVLAGLFFFLLFLFGGKGLVNSFFRLRGEVGHYFRGYRLKKTYKRESATVDRLRGEMSDLVAGLDELAGEEAYKINVLTSEYKLAFENRQLAASAPLKKLI